MTFQTTKKDNKKMRKKKMVDPYIYKLKAAIF